MKDLLFITQDLFDKLIELARYLEEHSLALLNLINELTFDEPGDRLKKDSYSKKLSLIYYRVQRIKEELVSSTINQNEIIKCDDAFKIIFKNLGDDLIHLPTICEEIVGQNYFVDANGILRKADK
ncbi:MAG: hypothetical protein ACYC4T_00925 [Melioribacteraceae bacterium]